LDQENLNSSLCIHDARNFDEYTLVLAGDTTNKLAIITTTRVVQRWRGKEETPKCRKKTVTRTNEMIEDLIDFIEIHPIVAFEAIYEPMLTSFWSLISFAVQLSIIMQYKGQHPPLLPKMRCKTCIVYTGLYKNYS
jgi:hypothetical protein